MKSNPERIYLQTGGAEDYDELGEVSWCDSQINDGDHTSMFGRIWWKGAGK